MVKCTVKFTENFMGKRTCKKAYINIDFSREKAKTGPLSVLSK
jgi:hypothetical protein